MAGRPDTKASKAKASASVSNDAGWQERAVERSINSARLRAFARSSQFLASAMELLEETGDVEFTVQNIVDRSGLSLRAFYQHFGSKDELLLSLFEELVTQFSEDLVADIDGIDDPHDRLEAYVRSFLGKAHASRPFGGRAWALYQMRLAAERPDDFARSIGPQVEILAGIVHHGVERKAFRTDVPEVAMTLLINSTLVSIAQMDVFGIKASGGPIGPDEVWKWCLSAIEPPAGSKPAKRSRPSA